MGTRNKGRVAQWQSSGFTRPKSTSETAAKSRGKRGAREGGGTDAPVGERFGGWIVLGYAGRPKRWHLWRVRCDCGTELVRQADTIRSGKSTRCGNCQRLDAIAVRRLKMSSKLPNGKRRPEYGVWVGMLQRCFNERTAYYADYGGRGIGVCPGWVESFDRFYEDMGARPSSKHTIERIDRDGDYEPGNCKWATWTEQARNRRNNRRVTIGERTLTVAEWVEISGTSSVRIIRALNKGVSPADAVFPALAKAGPIASRSADAGAS